MRKIFLVIFWGLITVLGFAQPVDSTEAVTVAEEESQEPDEIPEEPVSKPSIFTKYFRWGRENAMRKDFILSTLFFIWDADKQGIGEEMFTIHWSFLPFTSLGIGLGLSGLFDNFPQFAGLSVQGGFVVPITKKIKIFGDMFLDMGYGTVALYPGYDLGLVILLDTDFGIEIKYKGIWTPENRYLNALGIGWLWNFWL